MENWTDTAEGHFEASQDIEITSGLAVKKRPPNPSRFRFEKVNDNGAMTNVPASHGQWGGYRTAKAIAWIINVAPNAWLARCGDQTSNLLALTAAKSEAMAMAKGACGDYVVSNPVAHLNGLTAIVLEREQAT